MEQEHINKIIPQLLDKSIKHNKEILNRFTICDYFSTFESRNSKELLKYIQESNNRYKATKSGNKISSVVVRSEDALKPISERILTDNYYVNFNIEKERKQLKHKLNTKENKKIGQLMKKIKESTNTYSKSELNYRNKLNKILETKKKNSSKDVNKNHTVEKWNEVNLNLRTKEMIEQQNERNLKTVNDIFNEDDKAFNEEINNHIELLRELKEYICSKENKVEQEEDKKLKEIRHKLQFNKSMLKLLTYQKPREDSNQQNKVEIYSEPIDVKKISKYFVNGNITNNYCSLSTDGNINHKKKRINLNLDFIPKVDYKDTKNLVRDEAINSYSINKELNTKQKILSNKLRNNNLPLITEYDSIIRNKRKQHQIVQQRYKIRNCTHLSNEDAKKETFKANLRKILKKYQISEQIVNDFL